MATFRRPGMHSEVIDKLRDAAADDKNGLSQRDREFAHGLVSQWDKYGRLSDKQTPWVFTLLERAENATTTGSMQPKKAEHAGINLSASPVKLFEIFDKAKANDIQSPVIRFMAGDDQLRMNLSKDGKLLHIVTQEQNDEGRRNWLAAIDREGVLRLTTKRKIPEKLVETVHSFATNPSQAGKATGQRMKWCCFCARPLVTTDSLYYGYGPICAEKWGLEWGEARSHLKEDALDAIGKFIAEETKS